MMRLLKTWSVPLYVLVLVATIVAPFQSLTTGTLTPLVVHAQGNLPTPPIPPALQITANQVFTDCRSGGRTVADCNQTAIDSTGVGGAPGITADQNTVDTAKPPVNVPPAGTQNPTPTQGSDDTGCGLSSIDLCITNIVYVFTVGIMSVFAYVGGVVFSIAVNLSLNSVAYSLNFLSSGWAAVRDIANMAFIFMLIYLAFTIMLQAETHGTNKTLATIIIMALLINFSFFITRVVIDGGNILAVQFYNSIQAPSLDQSASAKGAATGAALASAASAANTKDLTASIMNMLQVTKLFNSDSFNAWRDKNTGFGGFMTVVITLSLLYIVLGIIFGILASTFFFVGFKFIYRIIALWFVIILAPLAFVARGFSTSSSKTFYKLWQNMLIQFAFYPAIFLFIFLMISYFVTQMSGSGNLINSLFTDFNTLNDATSQTFLLTMGRIIGSLAIRLGIVVVLLYFGLKVADMIVSEGNKSAEKVTSWAGRRLGGATYGVLGYAGRNSIGAAARSYAPALQQKASSQSSVTGKALWGTLNKANKNVALGSYDVRGVPRVQSTLLQSTRLDVGTPPKEGTRRGLLLSNVTDKSLDKLDKDTKKKIADAAKKQQSAGARSTQVTSAKISSIVSATRPQGSIVLPPVPSTPKPSASTAPNPGAGTPVAANNNAQPGTLVANPTDRPQTSFASYAAIPTPASNTGSGVAPQTAQTVAAAGYSTPAQPANTNVQGGRVEPTISMTPPPSMPANANVQGGRIEPTLGVIPAQQQPRQQAQNVPNTPPATNTPAPVPTGSAQASNPSPVVVPQPSPERAEQLSAEVSAQQTRSSQVPTAQEATSVENQPVIENISRTSGGVVPGVSAAPQRSGSALEEPARIIPPQPSFISADPAARLAVSSTPKPASNSNAPEGKSALQKAAEQVKHEEELEKQKEKDTAYFKTLKEMRKSIKKAGDSITNLVKRKQSGGPQKPEEGGASSVGPNPEHGGGGAEEKV